MEKHVQEQMIKVLNDNAEEMSKKVDEFNIYVEKIFDLLHFIPRDVQEKYDIFEDLDDALDTFGTKLKNKKIAYKLLIKYIPESKKQEFIEEIRKI